MATADTDSARRFQHISTYTTARLEGLLAGHLAAPHHDGEFIAAVERELLSRACDDRMAR